MNKKGKNLKDFNTILQKSLFPDSLLILKKNIGIDNIIISASFHEIIGTFCREVLNVKLISNSLLVEEVDVNYQQKLIALKQEFGSSIIIIKAYGNSSGDYDIFRAAQFCLYRTKKGELIRWIDPKL